MKKIFFISVVLSFAGSVIVIPCKKDSSCGPYVAGNKSPIAVAVADQLITLPTDSVLLDGSASSDPDGIMNGPGNIYYSGVGMKHG